MLGGQMDQHVEARVDETGDPVSRVCFIGATGRSGSTLVSRVLGSLPGACSVGELCWIWTYGVLRNRPCGCGRPFLECPFWTGVGRRAFGGWDQVDATRANDLRRRVTRNSRIPELLTRPLGATAADVDDYVALLGPLYASITAESGAAVIIDNSKQPEVALLARRTPGVDLSVLHLVRRSHGVAYSWTKHVTRADKAGREMLRRSPSRTAAAWLVDNALFEMIGRTGTSRLQLRYEDFVVAPRSSTREVVEFLGLDVPDADLPFEGESSVVLAPDHSVWGNPMRLQTGAIPLRPDEAWRSGLPSDARRTVSAISWPGLLRYGYLR
jgi:Sulfotransferase family